VLGRDHETSVPIMLSERARLEHAHVIGTAGGGETKFLEACIRPDIRADRGACVVDPHGDHPDSLYRSVRLGIARPPQAGPVFGVKLPRALCAQNGAIVSGSK
jgi:hypothetical protein